jgi:adenine-specific DNA-methyltransferase
MQPRIYKTVSGVTRWLNEQSCEAALFAGDCLEVLNALPASSVDLVVSSPPYCMGKEYEGAAREVETFIASHASILPLAVRSLKPGGSLCWQVGYHFNKGRCTPLDFFVMQEMSKHRDMILRNRIAWTFGHGLHASNRFSGRHETILWFTKGADYDFDLDAVRVPQKYPGKRHSSGPNQGQPSGNPAGKNPGDVWDIPNVKANHVEKTLHPCQFPVGLVQRLIRALTKKDDLVFDPFCGVASSGVAAISEGRRFLGAEVDEGYVSLGKERLSQALKGEVKFRPAERAVHVPKPGTKVASRPPGFAVSLPFPGSTG